MNSNPRSRRPEAAPDGERRSADRLRPTDASPTPQPQRPAASQTPDALTAAKSGTQGSVVSPRKLSPSEFNTAMVHFYRGEVQRSNTWRNRLDTTTNWAVLTAGATLSFVFSSSNNPHFVIPINSVLVAIFLVMEARRYRYYEIWSSRVRVLETGYFAQMLSSENTHDEQWAEHLAADLLTPHFTISEWEAIGRRLRRNYLWIFALLALSWNLKVYLHPLPARDFEVFLERAEIGSLSGGVVFTVGIIFNAAVLIFALATVRLREATGEVLPRHQFSLRGLSRVTDWTRAATAGPRRRATLRRAARARQRVRTASSSATGSTTGEFKRPDITKTPDKEAVTEETITR